MVLPFRDVQLVQESKWTCEQEAFAKTDIETWAQGHGLEMFGTNFPPNHNIGHMCRTRFASRHNSTVQQSSKQNQCICKAWMDMTGIFSMVQARSWSFTWPESNDVCFCSQAHQGLTQRCWICNSFQTACFFFVSKELQNSGKDPKSSMVEMALASNVWTGFNQGLLERHRLLPPIASFCLLYQAVPDGSLVSPWKSLLRVTFVPKSDLGSKLCFGICRERKHMAPACRCEDAKPDAQRCERYRQRQIRINILYK